jgi:cellulose synthase/poly-beta-1,6-N-acetylglucosamine synthase-like glycosyltransferase
MRVAVITPYYKEDLETLVRCHSSVAKQTYKDVVHYMVADGHPVNQVNAWECEHIVLPSCSDYGDTPRLVGCAVADARGVDAILLLDADCWMDENHVQNMVNTMLTTNAPVVTCPRKLWRMDGSYMGVDDESDGEHFNDTSCYLVRRDAFHTFRAWGLKDKKLAIVDDRVFWAAIKSCNLPTARNTNATVNYPTSFAFHYTHRNEAVPEGAKVIIQQDGELKMVTYPEFVQLTGRTKV